MLNKIREQWNRLNRPGKAGVVFAGVLIFYTLVGFLLIPFTLKKVALAKLPEVLNRPVQIERVAFNPYTLDLCLEGFAIGKKEGEGNLFAFKQFNLNFDSFSIFRLSLILDQIRIVDPLVDLSIFRGGSSVSDLIPEGDVEEEPQKDEVEAEKSMFPFIVRDLDVTNGTCRVYDKVRDVRHEIAGLDLYVPFTSSLSRDNEKQVHPTLNMVINGTPFVMKGHTLPFNQSLRTEFDFSLKNAQLAEYWPYLPIYETTELKSGSLSSDLVLSFERGDSLLPRVLISGKANISKFDLAARKGPSLLKFTDLDVELEEVSILQRLVKISSIRLNDPYLKVGLKEDGSPDLLDYLAPSIEAGEESKKAEDGTEAEGGPALAALVKDFKLQGGVVDFTDNAFGKGFNKKIGPIMVHAGNVSTAENAAGTWDFRIGSNATEIISGQGGMSVVPLAVNGSVALEDLDIPDYHAYLDDPLPLDVAGGKVGLGSYFSFAAQNGTMRLQNIRVNVDGLNLQPKGGGKTLIGLGGFAMTNGTVDVNKKSVVIDSIDLNKLLIKLMRDKKGIDLLKQIEKHQQNAKSKQLGVPAKEPDDSAETTESSDSEGEPWQVALNRFSLRNSGFEFTDRAATKKTVTDISDITIGVNGLTYPEKTPLRLDFSALVNKRGSIKVSGQAGPQSLKGKGSVRVRKLRLRDFNGYLPPEMQLNIARGHIDVNGNWNFSAANEPSAGYQGKVQLKDLLIRDNQGNKQFFHMDDLAVREIDFRSAPLKVKVGSIAVLAPQANLEREQDGTFNVARMLTGKRAEPVNEEAVEEQAEQAAEKAEVAQLDGVAPADGVAELQAPTAEEKKENNIFIDKIFMSNGTVTFKDYAVSPAFELDITKMRSAVRGLELPHGQRTDLSFNATLDKQSPLVAEGFLQPTTEGADTDINISLANLDMTQLSPYTEKFIAYPVSTGMLSSDVGVKLRGKLIAVDNVFDIYQFEVGEKVDNPDAPSIPIGLGLALLKDSSGNIRLDIPVEGDLSDPQFKLGRVIGRAIVNLLVKVVTSPFALIGSMFGGGEDMDVMAFEPGKDGFKEGEQAKVESVAKAMTERPGLKLEISGFTAPEDIPAMEEAEFRRQVAMPKFLDLEGDENAPESVDEVVVSEEEYPEYLETAYKDATFERPTNFLGIVVAQPVPDMEKALRDNIKITDTQLAELARKRAELVRTILVEQSGIGAERVFLKGMSATGKGAGPRVELGLQ
ncbi:DUF748 domain-containing protein [Desulfovibrio sp. JC010]|uniref:DUF748 domain-containing protein n=1 Tax=Desulfovibrio sp. JC010 TaxID=2593641 RepID=UPI0013D4B751|nr:DUF748 domain-containing protein [Desulfovibrio sp. JC010]NDV28887.1 DUF748 domain-containing protein [Desulfovibrio sp. JC010]